MNPIHNFIVMMGSILLTLSVSAQVQGDCVGAKVLELTLKNRVFEVETPPKGFGSINEISAPRADKFFFRKEHHTHWYAFTLPFTGVLSLEITPRDRKDDYDFLLFKDSLGNICERISNQEVKPVRSVISRNDTSVASRTGLSAYSDITHQEEGPGASYTRAIKVRRGETYYLVLDNVYGGGDGYTLEFNFYYLPKLFGTVTDSESGQPLPAKVYVETHEDGVAIDSILADPETGRYISRKPLEFEKDYKLVFFAEGYFMSFKKINFPILKENRNRSINASLDKLEEGINLTLDNINFNPGLPTFLKATLPNLRETLYLMQRYPSLKVELEGHVNGVGIANCETDEHSNQLSWDRAKAVRKYLVDNGIDPERISIQGYGCHHMLYPNATNERQKIKNRRVELKVLSLQ